MPGKAEALALSPDGTTVAVAFGKSAITFRTSIQFPGGMQNVITWSWGASSDQSVHLYNVATGQEVGRLRGHARPTTGLAFSPDGRRLVTAGGWDDTLKLWDPQSHEEILTFGTHRGTVTSVAFSPDGKKIVSTSLQDVRVWDATPLQP
jgi:WD40 repeat protein